MGVFDVPQSMDGISFELEGMTEVLENLELANQTTNRGANQVLRKGGEVQQESIEAHTPVGLGDKPGGHAKDNVAVSNVRTAKDTAYKHILVGYNSNAYWYMWFLEKGTYSKGNPKGISPRNQTERAFNASQPMVQAVMYTEMMELMKKVGSTS